MELWYSKWVLGHRVDWEALCCEQYYVKVRPILMPLEDLFLHSQLYTGSRSKLNGIVDSNDGKCRQAVVLPV